jgi:hypothetical protein
MELAAPVLKTEINGRGDSLRWPRDTLYPQKLTLTSPTTGGHSVGIVRMRTKGHGVCFVCLYLFRKNYDGFIYFSLYSKASDNYKLTIAYLRLKQPFSSTSSPRTPLQHTVNWRTPNFSAPKLSLNQLKLYYNILIPMPCLQNIQYVLQHIFLPPSFTDKNGWVTITKLVQIAVRNFDSKILVIPLSQIKRFCKINTFNKYFCFQLII